MAHRFGSRPSLRDTSPRASQDGGRARQDAFLGLLSAAADPDPSVQAAALESFAWAGLLGRCPGADIGPAAIPALQSESTEVRRAAARALGACGAPKEAAPPLRRLLASDSVAEVRAAAASALGSGARSPVTVRVLTAALRDKDCWARACAADALARLGATRAAIPALVAALRTPATAPFVRKRLDELGPVARRAMEPALEHLRSRLAALLRKAKGGAKDLSSIFLEPPIEGEIRQVLCGLGPDAAPQLPKLLESRAALDSVIDMSLAFARTGAPGAKTILRVLREANRWSVRERAASVLGAFSAQADLVIPGLVEAVRKDANAKVRAAAARSLAQIARLWL